MKKVSIDEAKESDVLARDLVHATGAPILSAGNKLSASIIARLKKMSVRELIIEQAAGPENEAERMQALAAIEARFRLAGNDPYLQEMKVIAIEHLNTL